MPPTPTLGSIQTRVDQVLVDLAELKQINREEHAEMFGRLGAAEQWQAKCEGRTEGRREWSGRLIALLVMAGTLIAGIGAVVGAYVR